MYGLGGCQLKLPEWILNSDLLGAAFGSLLGFFLAWLLLRYELRIERQAERKKKDEEVRQRLRHCMELLSTAVRGWRTTSDYYTGLAAKYKQSPFEVHLHLLSFNASERTLLSMDRIQNREAMMQLFGNKAGASMSARLNRVVDYFSHFLPVFEEAMVSLKEGVEEYKKQFDALQLDLTLELQAEIARLTVQPGPQSAALMHYHHVLQNVEKKSAELGFIQTPERIREFLVDPVLSLGSKGLPPQDYSAVRLIAMRAHNRLRMIPTQVDQIVAFSEERAKEMSRYCEG